MNHDVKVKFIDDYAFDIECSVACTATVHACRGDGLIEMGSPQEIVHGWSQVTFPRRHQKVGSVEFRTKRVQIVLILTGTDGRQFVYHLPRPRELGKVVLLSPVEEVMDISP